MVKGGGGWWWYPGNDLYSLPLTVSLPSTTTLNVPDPAERKYKNETSGSSIAWLAVFGCLAVLVAALLLSLLIIR